MPKKILASDENEQYHLTIIAKDPNSEQSRLEYSRFLYSKDRLTEALNQVGYVLKLNPKNLEAAKLAANINKLMVITDPQKRKQVQIEQITADLSQSVKALEAANNQIQKVVSPEALNSFEIEKAKRQQVLTEKYKIVGDREVCKHLLEGACDEDLIAAKFLVNGLKDQALSTYRRGLEKKEMANLRLGIIRILFGAKRIQESDEEVIKARNLYPKDLRFQIYQEGIGKLRQLASTESRETVRLEVMEQIGDINEILAKVCMPKK